jgi:hypothetical protein
MTTGDCPKCGDDRCQWAAGFCEWAAADEQALNAETCYRCGGKAGWDQDGAFCEGCKETPFICACIRPGASWAPVDLAAAMSGDSEDDRPHMLERDDGHHLLYNGKLHTIAGESESLKTWLALLAVADVINHGHYALFIDYEDSARSIAGRLLALGCAKDAIQQFLYYVKPEEAYGPLSAAILTERAPEPKALAVIDGITEAMTSHGLDPLSNPDVAAFNAKLPKKLAGPGTPVVMIDHVTKAREGRGRYAIGAQHKLSAVDGAAYIIDLIKPFGHGLHGMAKITISKDRPGRVREHSPTKVAGILHLRSQLDGSVLASIAPPASVTDGQAATTFRPTVLMERVSRYVEDHPGLSGRAIVAAVSGKTEHKRLALELLISEGWIWAARAGNKVEHKSVNPFRDDAGKDSADDQD